MLETNSVVKVYGDLSLLLRNIKGVIDVMVGESGLGPAVRRNTDEGIAHNFVPGRILEEQDMHGSGVGKASCETRR